jgi:hypothetical protein
MNNKDFLRKIIWISLFAIAMAFRESAVVVYLRQIYYPEGFDFPLKEMQSRYILTEVFREIATLLMISSLGFISAKTSSGRFGVFLYIFGIWDIFYYVFLKIILGWPSSLMTWDILFLIPTIWTGPVLAPCLNAFTMIILGGSMFFYEGKTKHPGLKSMEWIYLGTGAVIILFTYMKDYIAFLLKRFSPVFLLSHPESGELSKYSANYIPLHFSWIWFIIGQSLILLAIILYIRRMNKN